jgi:hypothetical protein
MKLCKAAFNLAFFNILFSKLQTNQTTMSVQLPSDQTLKYAAKISIIQDKPIQMDYWESSLNKTASIGIRLNDSNENILVKSAEEYTSTICKRYVSGSEFIILTENTIYIVSSEIESVEIN